MQCSCERWPNKLGLGSQLRIDDISEVLRTIRLQWFGIMDRNENGLSILSILKWKVITPKKDGMRF